MSPTFYPNEGEILMMMASCGRLPLTVGLFRNQVAKDGYVTFNTFTELSSIGSRAYARKTIENALALDAAVQYRWHLYTNALGKAQADYYHQVPPTKRMEFSFNATDEADGYSVRGGYAWATVIPFDAGQERVGTKKIKVGDTIEGAISGATAVVAGLFELIGSWPAGTMTGWLTVKDQAGAFQNDENLLIAGEVGTIDTVPTAGGTGYAVGDLVEITPAGGGRGALAVVTAETAGVVDTLHLAASGSGYEAAAGQATTKLTGAGNDDLTVEVTALSTTAYAVSDTGTAFAGDSHKKVLMVEILNSPILVRAAVPIYLEAVQTGHGG
jgi:hypothetical protein